MKQGKARQRGFTLIELMVAVGMFAIIAGAVFELLILSQRNQKTEMQLLDSFQAARLSVDQIVRDVSNAGYPPPSFSSNAASPAVTTSPFAWSPNYTPATPCTILGNCVSPSATDLIIEANFDPTGGGGVRWVRYVLQGTTLFRADVPKVLGDDPIADTNNALYPYVQNVVNLAPPGGGPAVNLFQYDYDSQNAPGNGGPGNILDVTITLVVVSRDPDPRTGQPRVAELNGRARRINVGLGGSSAQGPAFPGPLSPPQPGAGGGGGGGGQGGGGGGQGGGGGGQGGDEGH